MPAEFGLGLAVLVAIPLFVVGVKLIRGGGKSPVEVPAPIVPPGFSQPSGVDLAGGAQPAPVKKPRRKLTLALILGVAFIGQLFACGVSLRRSEQRWRAELPDLGKAPLREVPPGQPNAADLYLEAGNSLSPDIQKNWPQARAALNKPWADPDGTFGRWLDDHEKALDSARKAANLPFCDFVPADVKRINTENATPQLGRVVLLGQLLLLDARRNEANGRPQSALEDVAASLSLAQRLNDQKNPLLIFQLLAVVLRDAAYAPAASLLGNPAVPPAVYVGLRDALVHASPSGTALTRAMAHDRSLYEEANSRYLEHVFWWLPGAIRRGFIEDYRKTEQAFAAFAASSIERNDPSGYEARRTELLAKYPKSRSSMAEEVGHCIKNRAEFAECFLMRAPPGAPDYGALIARSQLADSRVQLLFAAAGVRLRELQAAAPPASLPELVPEHLPRAPYDPFDGGKALHFTASNAGWSVYSLGADRKDDEGSPAPPPSEQSDWRKPESGDLVLSALRWIPPKAPRKPRRAG